MRFSPSTFTTGMCCLILMVTNLKDELKQKLPQWYQDTENKYGLILTDDLDSLLGCAILKAKMNWDIQEIMLFNAKRNYEISVDWHGVADNATHEAIGVDFAKVNGKCFDNHLCMFNSDDTYNKEAINLNHIYGINRNSYTKKYNLSTALLLWSLYDLPKNNLPDELMMLLLCIDGINDLLLWDTPCWIELSTNKFYTKDFYKDITVDIKNNPQSISDICDDPYCYALTRKNQIKYSERIDLDVLRQRVKKQNNNL